LNTGSFYIYQVYKTVNKNILSLLNRLVPDHWFIYSGIPEKIFQFSPPAPPETRADLSARKSYSQNDTTIKRNNKLERCHRKL